MLEEILKNTNDYVLIDGTYYKKDDPLLVKIGEFYYLFNRNKHIKSDVSDKFIFKRNCVTLVFLDEEGEKEILNCHASEVTDLVLLYIDEIFHDKKIIKKSRDSFNYLNNFLCEVRSNLLMRIDQCEKLGFFKNNNGTFSSNKKVYTPLENQYHSFSVKKNKDIFPTYKTNIIANKNYTFGVEMETNKGVVGSAEMTPLNIDVTCTRDGSITGGEYITGVLRGDEGFYDLYKLAKIVSKNCTADATCGIHVHIGDAVFNKLFSLSSYVLGCMIQDELFTLLHPTRSNNLMCGKLKEDIKNKIMSIFDNSESSTRAIDLSYHFLFKLMSNGEKLSKYNNKFLAHKGGRYCGRYQIHGGRITDSQFRYKWLNLIPCNFNQRKMGFSSKDIIKDPLTIEFRNYQSSMDFLQIKDWVLFCMAFTSYVEKFGLLILKGEKKNITVLEIIESSYDRGLYERIKKNKMSLGKETSLPEDLSFSQLIKNHKSLCA